MIPQFIPYNPNQVPSKAEVEEYDANNEKMKSRLAKEDKTKRAEVDKPVDRPKNYWVIDGGVKELKEWRGMDLPQYHRSSNPAIPQTRTRDKNSLLFLASPQN
ncbi:unnamed protein product [Rhizophagus irregularis]|nr:unnamed protein product [Rhizophagus irregularis]